jgi:hypothetical protein
MQLVTAYAKVQELRTSGQVNEQVEAQAKQIVDSALVLLWKWMSDVDNDVYVYFYRTFPLVHHSSCDLTFLSSLSSAPLVLGFVHEYLGKVNNALHLYSFVRYDVLMFWLRVRALLCS